MISTAASRFPQEKIAARVGQLLRLSLSATIPGEAFAALAAIKRTIDLHVLADAVEIGLKTPTSPAPSAPPPAASSWRSTARFCRLHEEQLSPKEIQFLDAILKYRGDISEKQMKWLRDIAQRAGVQ
jgi:hypothetical protein